MLPKFIHFIIHVPERNVSLLSNFLFQTPNLYSTKNEMHYSISYLLLSLSVATRIRKMILYEL